MNFGYFSPLSEFLTKIEQNIHKLQILNRKKLAENFLAFFNKIIYYINMYKVLRIIFSVLAAILAAVAIFVFVYAPNFWWGIATVMLAFVFGALMVTFKSLQEKKERKENPPPAQGDFIFGKAEQNTENKENNDDKQ